MLASCASNIPAPVEPELPSRLEFSQRILVPSTQTAQVPPSMEHVALGDPGIDAPRPINSINTSDAQWIVFDKAGIKPSGTEATAGEGIANGLVKNVYFPLNSAELENEESLKDLSLKLNQISGQINLFGFTDPSGTEHRNKELSVERAAAVKEKLVEFGVKESRIKANGAGISRLYADNSKNRRTSIFLEIE